MGVPLNYTFIDGFSIKNHPAIGGTPMTMETPIYQVWVAPFSHCPLNFYTLVMIKPPSWCCTLWGASLVGCDPASNKWIDGFAAYFFSIYTMLHHATSWNILQHLATASRYFVGVVVESRGQRMDSAHDASPSNIRVQGLYSSLAPNNFCCHLWLNKKKFCRYILELERSCHTLRLGSGMVWVTMSCANFQHHEIPLQSKRKFGCENMWCCHFWSKNPRICRS